MSKYPIADKIGVTQAAIKKALGKNVSEQDLFKFLHGSLDTIYKTLPRPSNEQRWESTGKRYVHLEEARFVSRFLLRNNLKPGSERALVLAGTDPALACLPWIMGNIASSFDAYEQEEKVYKSIKERLFEEIRKIKDKSCRRDIELNLIPNNCLDIKGKNKTYGVIDLDFCNNHLRKEDQRNKITKLIDKVSPKRGPFVLRTTAHIGRTSNSKEDVQDNIEEFENLLRGRKNKYRILARNQSPYQSTLPMISLVWILERKKRNSESVQNDVTNKIWTYTPASKGKKPGVYEIILPNGNVHVTNNLIEYSKENSVDAIGLYRVAAGSRRTYKGMKCRKLYQSPRTLDIRP